MGSVPVAGASQLAREVVIVTQSRVTRRFSAASSGLLSANSWGCSSASHVFQRDIAPEVWCSVSRYVVMTYGKRGFSVPLVGLSGRSKVTMQGLFCWRGYSAFRTGDSHGS